MSHVKVQSLKGFRDFLPEKMIVRNEVIKRLKNVFDSFGFKEIQTPSLEFQDVLLGKYGKEAEKLMYLFDDPGERKVGLRYDLTVPLARVVSGNDLPIPFKRYQIQPVWRAENTQKGRYREFYQCDIDTIGSPSPLSDAEILAVINKSLLSLNFSSFRVRVNSRTVLFSAMEKSGVDKNKWLSAIQSIDKLDKKSGDEVEKELSEKGLTSLQIKNVFREIKLAKPDDYLEKTISIAKKMGVNSIVFDSILSRGLDYYTGPIFETVVDNPKIGSITGGGRYDELLKTLGGPDLPAVGTTIGLDRACDVIEELNLWPNLNKTMSKAIVTVFSPELLNQSIELVNKLRDGNINIEIFPDESAKLDKQLKFADKTGIPFALIVGPEEAESGKITLKNLQTQKQEELTFEEVLVKLS